MLDRLELSLLIDYYGSFLTETQREILALSCDEDYSLSEIAEQRAITRQGVRDAISRGEKTLVDMEERLGLIKRDKRALDLIGTLKDECSLLLKTDDPDVKREHDRMLSLLTELSDIMEGNDGV